MLSWNWSLWTKWCLPPNFQTTTLRSLKIGERLGLLCSVRGGSQKRTKSTFSITISRFDSIFKCNIIQYYPPSQYYSLSVILLFPTLTIHSSGLLSRDWDVTDEKHWPDYRVVSPVCWQVPQERRLLGQVSHFGGLWKKALQRNYAY